MNEPVTSKMLLDFSARIDNRFAEHGKRIAEFDSIRAENKNLKAAITDLSEKHDKLAANLAAHSAALDKFAIAHKESAEHTISKIDGLASSLSALSNAHANTKVRILAAESSISSAANSITQHNAKINDLYAVRADLSTSKMDIVGIKETASKNTSNAASEMQKIASVVQDIKSSVLDLQRFKEQYSKDKQDISAAHKKLNDDIMSGRQNATDHIVTQCQSLTNNMSEKIAAIKIPDISGLVSIERVSKIESQLIGFALDVKNALIKTSNLDIQTQLHNKKIENIQVQLKQHELTK